MLAGITHQVHRNSPMFSHFKGYSLIELVIVFAIIGLVLPTIFALFFLSIRAQLEVNGYTYARKEGDRVQEEIVRTWRNANTVQTTCGNLNTSVCSVDKNGQTIAYVIDAAGQIEKRTRIGANPYTPKAITVRNTSSAYDIQISACGSPFGTVLMKYTSPSGSGLTSVCYKLTATPRTNFLRSQSLDYRFLIAVRK